MKHLIYAAIAVSALGLATGAFACGAHQDTASLANGKMVVAQLDQNAPATQNQGESQDNGANIDDDTSDHE